MRYSYALIPLVSAMQAMAIDADTWYFGNSLFYLGPPSGNSAITKATYSIVPPTVPSGAKVSNTKDEPWVSVWVGASSSAGDDNTNLYQPIFNWSLDQESQYVEFDEIPSDERKGGFTDCACNIGVVPHLLMSGVSQRALLPHVSITRKPML
jgi:hypothetical protein